VLDWAVSARTEYLLAPPTYVFRFRADDSWWAKATSSADWVWLATSLLGFAVLGLARFEKVALRFWPTVCFPLSVLWIRWSQNPGLGWLLFAVCTFAAAWMVRGWFVHTTIRSSISVSTVLKQELSKFTSLGSESGKQR
jgi:hypothetical protein